MTCTAKDLRPQLARHPYQIGDQVSQVTHNPHRLLALHPGLRRITTSRKLEPQPGRGSVGSSDGRAVPVLGAPSIHCRI